MQVWNGTICETEHKLLDVPVGIISFGVQSQSEVRLAVAAGADVYIFIGLKPHYKASVPLEDIHEQDAAVWHAPSGFPTLWSQQQCQRAQRNIGCAGMKLRAYQWTRSTLDPV